MASESDIGALRRWAGLGRSATAGCNGSVETGRGGTTWNSDVWNLHGGDRDAIILGSETTSGFNVDSISSDPVEPVPEPSTFLLFAAGVCGVGYWRRRIQNSILVSQQKKLGFLGKGSPDSRRP